MIVEIIRSVVVTGIAAAILVAAIEYAWHRVEGEPEPCLRKHRDEL